MNRIKIPDQTVYVCIYIDYFKFLLAFWYPLEYYCYCSLGYSQAVRQLALNQPLGSSNLSIPAENGNLFPFFILYVRRFGKCAFKPDLLYDKRVKDMDYEKLYAVYGTEGDHFLHPYCLTDAMQRLAHIGMNCGLEYTGFRYFTGMDRYTRYMHSLGTAYIIWRFTGDPEQALSGLFHDIATPVFSHVVDFIHGDQLKQESTESLTEAVIRNDRGITGLLASAGIEVRDIADYHRYPIADNDSPRLSADRLEYTCGNIVQFGIDEPEFIRSVFDDLETGRNEDGDPEIIFRTIEKARQFASYAMECGKIYCSPEDRYSMQMLAEILKEGIRSGVLSEDDLMRTEGEIISKLESSPSCGRWTRFRKMNHLLISDKHTEGEGWISVQTKKRYIDPFIKGKGRLSAADPSFAALVQEYLADPMKIWMKGVHQ